MKETFNNTAFGHEMGENGNAMENQKMGSDEGRNEFFKEEKRQNLEAIEKKRDEYILEAIKAISKKPFKGPTFSEENIDQLTDEVFDELKKKHNDVKNIDDGGDSVVFPATRDERGTYLNYDRTVKDLKMASKSIEIEATYPIELIKEMLIKYMKEHKGTFRIR